MGGKVKKVVRKVAKKILPDKVEKAALGPTEADIVRAQKEAEPEVVEDKTEDREIEQASRSERERAARRRSRRAGRRSLLYGRLGAPVEEEGQQRTLG